MPLKIFNSKKALNESAVNFDGLIEITDELRVGVQQTLLEMYDDIKKVCDTNGIILYLGGGTALGAVRHRGFIPWDDDLDINIERKDFEKFKNIFEQSELREKYILNAPNYSEHPKARFPQLIKRGTVFEEINDSSTDVELKGIKIDFFTIENAPDSRVVRCFKGLRCNFLEFIAAKVQLVESSSPEYKELTLQAGKSYYYISYFIGKVFSIIDSRVWLNKIDNCIQGKNFQSKYCTCPTGRGHYFGELLPREVYFPAIETEFCGRKAFINHEPEKYLKNVYGDYNQIPPEEKRERHFIKNIDLGD